MEPVETQDRHRNYAALVRQFYNPLFKAGTVIWVSKESSIRFGQGRG